MPVGYTSYKSSAIQAGITMLAASATWQSVLNVSGATAAKARIVESWGGTPALAGGDGKAKSTDGTSFTMKPPWAWVRLNELDVKRTGFGIYGYRGRVEVSLLLPRRLNTEAPAESWRRANNHADSIRAEIIAQFGSSGAFAEGDCSIDGPAMPDEASADGDAFIATIFIDFEG